VYVVGTAIKNTLLIGYNCNGPTNAVAVVKLVLKHQIISHFNNISSINHAVCKRKVLCWSGIVKNCGKLLKNCGKVKNSEKL
jgi:hypothetical protein